MIAELSPAYTVERLGELTGLGAPTIKNLIHTGELRATKVGNRNVLSLEDAQEVFSRGGHVPTSKKAAQVPARWKKG